MGTDHELRILFVEDVASDYEMEVHELRRQGRSFTSLRVDTREDFLQALGTFKPDLILSDYSMPAFDGMSALLLSLQHDATLPFIIITGSLNEETAVACMKAGATDYVLKNQLRRLPFAIDDALREKQALHDKAAADQALRVSEDRFRSVVEQAEDGIAIMDQQGNIIVWNRSRERLTGISRDDALGRPVWDIQFQLGTEDEKAAPGAYERVKERFERFIETGTAPWLNRMIEREVQQKDGARLVIQTVIFPIRTEQGPLLCSVMRDVTQARRAEAQVRLQSAALEAAANAILITDRTGAILWANRAFSVLSGYTVPESVGKNLRELLKSGHQPAAFYSKLWETILAGQVWHDELVNRRKDGNSYCEEMTITPLVNDRSEITHFIAVKQDISNRKKAEESLRQRLAELEALHDVSTALRTATTVDQALAPLLEKTLAALDTDTGVISLYDPERSELSVGAVRGWMRQVNLSPIKPGEGLGGTVLATGKAIFTADLAHDPMVRVPDNGKIPPGWSAACVPIHAAAEPVGVLMVSLPSARQVTEQQKRLLESVAEMAGATIHRLRLHEETVRQIAFLKALHEIDVVVSSSFDLHVILNVLLGHVIEQMGVDATDVLLLHPQLQTLEYGGGQGFRASMPKPRVRLGDSLGGRVALERRVVQVSGAAGVEDMASVAAQWAAEEFVFYCGIPLIAKGRVKGVLEVFKRSPFSPDAGWLSFLQTLAGQAAVAIDDTQLFDNLQRANFELAVAYAATIEGWSRALDLRDKETEGHTERVTEMTLRLARQIGFSDSEIAHIRQGALLHDIGKMGVPDAILLKPGKLTDEEWIIMRRHPTLAYELLAPIAYLRDSLDIPYCHHEKWDGTGYPRGLKGEQIPLAARAFAVVDVWDALLSDRPYRKRWPQADVIAHIRAGTGTHFDPHIVDVFLAMVAE